MNLWLCTIQIVNHTTKTFQKFYVYKSRRKRGLQVNDVYLREGIQALTSFSASSSPSATLSAKVHYRCNPLHSQIHRLSGPGIQLYVSYVQDGQPKPESAHRAYINIQPLLFRWFAGGPQRRRLCCTVTHDAARFAVFGAA